MRFRARYRVLGLLTLLSIITYMDRVCIAVAATRIREEFGITLAGWGWVMAAFTLAYAAFEIPSGAMGDRFGERRVLTRIVVWWSAFTVLTGLTSNYVGLLVTRFLFGAGEAGAYPNATGSVRHWFPPAERAQAQGWVWGASRIGGALTPILVVPLMHTFGWRVVFYLFGGVGFLWAAAWWIWYRDRPSDHPGVSPAERLEIGEEAPGGHDVVWRKLAQSPQLWLIMLMYGCYAWGATFYILWLPEFVTKGRGFSDPQMAAMVSLAFVMGAAGNLAGGFVSDRWSRRYGPRIGRVAVGAGCLLVNSFLLFAIVLCRDAQVTAILLALGFGVIDCMLPCAWAVCLDVGGNHAGTISGAMNTAGQAGSFACSVLFGYLAEWSGGYDVPITVIATMVLLSSVLFTLIDPTRPILQVSASSIAEEARCV